MLATLLICTALTAVDGDTIRCDGVTMRDMGDGRPFVSGYNAPETGSRGECRHERQLGEAAKQRLGELLREPGTAVYDSGQRDRYQRQLVSVRLSDGRSAGAVLISEGLAVEWPHRGNPWCP